MRSIIFGIAIASLLVLVAILIGFPTPNEKANNAHKKLEKAKINAFLVQRSTNEVADKVSELKKSKIKMKECEMTIKNNDRHINEMKSKIKNDGSTLDVMYENRASAIKMKNYQLQKKIIAIENNLSNWEQLKRELTKDLEEFTKKIRSLMLE